MEKKQDTQQQFEEDVEPIIEEEAKGTYVPSQPVATKPVVTKPVVENEESKKISIRNNLMQLINQLDNRAGGNA